MKENNEPNMDKTNNSIHSSNNIGMDCEELLNLKLDFHPADMADQLEQLSLEEQISVLQRLDSEDAAETLAELDEDVATDVLENLDLHTASRIIAEMSPDDAADVLDELEDEQRNALLNNINQEDAELIRDLLSFDPDTAAGVMNTEIIMLNSELTVDEAILSMRQEMEDKEIPYYAYIINQSDILIGVLSLRDLMLSKQGIKLIDRIGNQDLITVLFDQEKSEAARLISHYNLFSIPVVDVEGRLLGVVTHDDVIDIIHDEASSDMLGMVGAGQDESIDTAWQDSVKMRLPWLVVNLFTSALSATMVYMFEGSIAQMAILAVLMPMVANQAGNTGQQALAVMIRQLAVERFDAKKSWKAVVRECKIGLCTGLVMSILIFLGVYIIFSMPLLGLVTGLALSIDMCFGAIAGGSIPLIFRALGRDPAQASSIFLTAITDGAGFFIFLGLATLIIL